MRETLVIKVGTSTLIDQTKTNNEVFSEIARSIGILRERFRVVLVTSGAVGFGMRHLSLAERSNDIVELQALSMLGQVGLMDRWQRAFGDVPIGQVLLTRRELDEARPVESLRRSITMLWEYGAVPVINENDAISNEEFGFSDNDQLSAMIAVTLGAKKLLLLTDQDGVQQDFGSSRQQRISRLSIDDADRHIDEAKSAHGTGGIRSKIEAARLALEHDIDVYVAKADMPGSIEQALLGRVGTNVVR